MSKSSITAINQLIKLGEFEKAKSACMNLLDEDQTNTEAFCRLGEICLLQEKEVEAQIFFEKAVKIDPDNSRFKEKLEELQFVIENGKLKMENTETESSDDQFYIEMFTKSDHWSTPKPNGDEISRWNIISRHLKKIVQITKRNETNKMRILDLGCGRGWLTNLASEFGVCYGIDPVAGVIDYARKLFPDITFFVGNYDALLNSKDFQPYDVIISSEVFEHIPQDKKDHFVKTTTKLLKPDGYIVLTTPRGDILNEWMKYSNSPDQPVEDWLIESEVYNYFVRNGYTACSLDRVTAQPQSAPYSLEIYQVWLFHLQMKIDTKTLKTKREFFSENNYRNNFNNIEQWGKNIGEVTEGISSAALQYVPENGIVVDVGANVGVFTEQILKQRRCSVVLFEPVSLYNKHLINKFMDQRNVTIENLALSNNKEVASIWLDKQNLGWNTLVKEKTTQGMSKEQIRTITFDEYCEHKNISHVDVIKIDVEGAEFKVLQGMRNFIKKTITKPVILLEIGWGKQGHPFWEDEVKEFEWLFENGYERFDYENVNKTMDVVIKPIRKLPVRKLSLTVGIPTRNRIKPLFDLLESIQKQTFKDFELIISDDGTKYNLKLAIEKNFPDLDFRYVKGPQKNLPMNRQNIYDNAITELVVMVDDDHVLDENCLLELYYTAIYNKDAGIVSAIWPTEEGPTIDFDSVKDQDEYRVDLKNVTSEGTPNWLNGWKTFYSFHSNPKLIEMEFAGGGCILYRKSAVAKAGGFPNYYSVVSFREDTDISHRIFLSGYRLLLNAKAIAYHHCSDVGGCRDAQDTQLLKEKDALLFLKKLDEWRKKFFQLSDKELRTTDLKFAHDLNFTNLDDKEIINCLLCGSEKSSVVYPPDIVKCNECGFVYLKERPTQKWMENYYKETYAVNDPAAAVTVAVPSDVELLDTKDEFIEAQRRNLFEEAVAIYGKKITGGTLVDIGCGWGGLLYNARKNGMNVIGFEFTNHNVQFAHQVLNLDVRQQQFVDSDLPENSVDIVTMSHVLEHIPDPLKLVMKINSVLKPEGIFYCVVPNFYSLSSAYLGEKWEWLDRNWHYSQFSVDSIKNLFLKVGLSVEQFSTTSGDFGTTIPTQILKYKFPDKSDNELTLLLNELNSQNYGEEIRIIGRKSENEATKNKNENDKNILWIRTDAIGDNILASSMLKPLKEVYSDYKITVVCQNIVRELYATSPYVDNIISFDTRKLYSDKTNQQKILAQLKALNAEYAFNSIFSRELLSDYLTINSGAINKIAHEGDLSNILKAQKEENNKLYTKLIKTNPLSVSELERHTDFLTGIGVANHKPEATIWLNEEDSSFAENVFSTSELNGEKTIALFTGAQHEVRIFSGYGKALNDYCSQNGFGVIVLGSCKDEQINQLNINDLTCKVVDLTGKTTIRQSAAIMKKCTAAVGSETGLAHIACAVGIPNLILIGGGHFGRFMPYSRLTSVVVLPLDCFGCNWQCKYGTTTCIKDIEHKVISSALNSMMKGEKNKTTVYLQQRFKYEFLSALPKISAIEHFLRNDVEVQVLPSVQSDDGNFLDTVSELGDKNFSKILLELNELFIKNGKDVKLYTQFEKKLAAHKMGLNSFLNSVPEKFSENAFYNYLKGLLFEYESKFEKSYDYYLVSMNASENSRVLYKLAYLAEKNLNIPYLLFLYDELVVRGVETDEMVKKVRYWNELLSINNMNKLSPIESNLLNATPNKIITTIEENFPLISFVLPSKNRASGLEAFLNSLKAACFGINYEVLLYAGDEIDIQYSHLIEQYNIKKVYLDKEIFERSQSFSWTKLMNHGFAQANGKWIMYASDDIVLHPLSVNFALQLVKDIKVGGISFMHRNTIQDYDGFFKEYGYDVYGERPFINFGLIKKEAFQIVNGFDETLKFYAGDTDICWRIIENKYKILPSYYSLVEHINLEDKTKFMNSGKTYRADTFTFYKKWIRNISKFENRRIVRERFIIANVYNVKKYIYQMALNYNLPIENIMKIDKEYEQFLPSLGGQEKSQIKVTAIISTYNSEKFIKGCLDDLLAQTLYRTGELEIVVIDSGSEEGEGAIVKEYQQTYPNIIYERTEKETIFAAWNRGIILAKGKYLTNANTDDRHANDALHKMAILLDEQHDVSIVYADIFKTIIPNDSITSKNKKEVVKWVDYDPDLILFGCFIGPQPMWRKSLHATYGLFDVSLEVVGDYEFWLRLNRDVTFYHLNETLGLYYYSENSAEHRNNKKTISEDEKVREYYSAKNISTYEDLNRIMAKVEIIGKVNEFKVYYEKAKALLMLRQKGLELEEKINEVIDKSNSLTAEESITVFKQLIDTLNNSEILLSRDKYLSILKSLLGDTYLKMNLFDEAKTSFENALMSNPESSEACKGLGEIFMVENNFEGAKTMLEWAVKNNPENQSALNSLAKVNQLLGLSDGDNSLTEQKSVDEQIEALFAETYALYEKKLFNESLAVLIELEKFIETSPEEIKPETAASVFNLSGFNYLALGENDKARQSFEKALNTLPDSSTACAGLGEIFYLEEKDEEAKIMYEWAVKNDPTNQMAMNGLNKINEVLGMERNHNSLNASPNVDEQLEALFSETYSLYEKKLYKEALAVLRELEKFVTNSSEEIHPDTLVSVINLSGYNYLGLNDIDNARESFERALNINPGSSSACAGLGEIYATFAMDTEAKTMFEWAVKNNPENQTAVSSLAKVNQKLGFAQNHNSLVLKNINPLRTIENKLDVAEELIGQDRNDEAEILLQEVLAGEPTNVIALNNLSVIEIMKEHYEDAVKLIAKVLAINPDDEIALANMNFIKEKLNSVLEQA